jgi:ABC-type nitrate/sulfonate/bicarbonate transport system ATPase subunit
MQGNSIVRRHEDVRAEAALHEAALALMLSLWQVHRPAVMLVRHDVDEAMALADRVLVLDRDASLPRRSLLPNAATVGMQSGR